MNRNKSCCFIGHRKIEETPELKAALVDAITDLITNKNVDTFFLGSKSQFNDLCKEILKELKNIYPYINRIYVRAEYRYINDDYKAYLLESCDDTYFPKRILGAGKAAYVERNYEMIDKSLYCIVYFKDGYAPPMRKNSRRDLFAYQPKSGTKIAYDYAVKKGCVIKNLYF